MPFGINLRAAAGNTIANIGKAARLPEFGISEAISGNYKAPTSNAQVLGSQTKTPTQIGRTPGVDYAGPAAFQQYVNSGGSYGGGSTGGAAPASGGQSYGGDSGGGSGVDQSYVDRIRSEFGNVRGGFENAINSYDSDYNLGKQNTEAAIGRAKDTLNTQNQQDEVLYGENLKSLLQSDKDIRQRSQGTFSALGSLDSSAYRDDVTKADQSLLDNQQKIGRAKTDAYNERQKQYSAYEQKANSDLQMYANEISRAKSSLQQAIAEQNINEAGTILSYIDQMKQRAQGLQDQQIAMKMQLAQLAAQGVDVAGNLSRLNTADFSNQFGSGLKNQLSAATSRYALPGGQVGSGYIGSSKDDQLKRLGLA